MIYKDFQECRLSMLGFGTMRLPLNDDKSIDAAQTAAMVKYAIDHGVNYFDTAYPYHDGKSETVVGECLKAYPRESFFLADKFPGHQISESYYPQEIFEDQLRKCQVDYFDFYLMHNVNENSIDIYEDPKWGILDYFVKQKQEGRIRHLGFSSHGEPALLKRFLDGPYGKYMEFCQIQLNYLDWDLQKAGEKVSMLNERGIRIWVMEPLRGGKLANLSLDRAERLAVLRPDESPAAWALRWLQSVPGVTMILSGMSALPQMEDNIRTFEAERPLSSSETALLAEIAASLHNGVPCTGCRYCCSECPQGLDIPMLMQAYNDFEFETSFTPLMRMEYLPADQHPSSCLGCGACAAMCPQKIDIPGTIEKLNAKIEAAPSWAKICAQRNAALTEMRNNSK